MIIHPSKTRGVANHGWLQSHHTFSFADYYNPESEKKDIAEVIIAKHRGGSLGTAELLWLGSYTKFVNLERRFDD